MHHSQNKIITETETEHLDVVWDVTQAKEGPDENKAKITQLWSRLFLEFCGVTGTLVLLA